MDVPSPDPAGAPAIARSEGVERAHILRVLEQTGWRVQGRAAPPKSSGSADDARKPDGQARHPPTEAAALTRGARAGPLSSAKPTYQDKADMSAALEGPPAAPRLPGRQEAVFSEQLARAVGLSRALAQTSLVSLLPWSSSFSTSSPAARTCKPR